MIEFEWDEAKRRTNAAKHNIDFKRAEELFDGRPMLLNMSVREDEIRFVSIGVLDGEYTAAVWTVRGSKIRLISARRARHEERRAYRKLYS